MVGLGSVGVQLLPTNGFNSTVSFHDRSYQLQNDSRCDGPRCDDQVGDGGSGMSEAELISEYYFHRALYQVAVPIAFSVIIAVGVVGNILVATVTLSHRKMRASTVSLLLLNLAASDLLFLVVCVPFMAYHFAADNWLLGEAACKIAQYSLYVTVYVTVYTLVAIAIIR